MDFVTPVIEQSFKLIKRIKDAIGDLKSAPKNLDDLRQQVSRVQSILKNLQSASGTVKIKKLRSTVKKLNTALSEADQEIRKYNSKDRRNVGEVVKAFFGQGAAKQNKHVGEIAQQIHKLSDTLDKEVNALTLVIVSGSGHVKKPQIVKNLDELDVKTMEEKICKISYHTIPNVEIPQRPRASREGGIEIHNYTKVRFEIKVDKNFFFYVVNYDNATGLPELFHPNYTSANHSVSSKNIRHFPDRATYKRDPSSFVIERTKSTSTEGHQMQTVYFVLSPKKMHEDVPPRQLKIKDIAKKIKLEAKPDIIVRKFVFDVKPVKATA